jgi:NAD(P)-dependent dehydrogenase (short-subunit alcohol dehydrogenase family)
MTDTIVLTGGTNGLGRVAAKALARPGLRLVLVARDEAKATATCRELSIAQPHGLYDYVISDFSRLATVAAAGMQIAQRYPRIGALINNAGIHAFSQRITPDGFPEMVSTNYLAPWLLTAHLRRALIAGAPARVVTVASEVSRRVHGLDPLGELCDLTPFSRSGSSIAYAKTKLMNIIFSAELGRSLDGTGVIANCLDPGFNVTGLGRELPGAAWIESALRFLGVGAPERGAAIIARLATAPEFATMTGGYFSREGRPLVPAAPAADVQLQSDLWNVTERLLAPFDRTLKIGWPPR